MARRTIVKIRAVATLSGDRAATRSAAAMAPAIAATPVMEAPVTPADTPADVVPIPASGDLSACIAVKEEDCVLGDALWHDVHLIASLIIESTRETATFAVLSGDETTRMLDNTATTFDTLCKCNTWTRLLHGEARAVYSRWQLCRTTAITEDARETVRRLEGSLAAARDQLLAFVPHVKRLHDGHVRTPASWSTPAGGYMDFLDTGC